MLLVAASATAQSALNARQFKKHWTVESESPDYRVTFLGDTLDIVAPKGLTLWRKEKLKADCAVEYDVQVVDKGAVGDRLSDMNCFWLATDPQAGDIWKRASWRSGIFVRCYTLQMYYLGYGGNSNTTTRFRRYTGDGRGVDSTAYRPAILKEYTDGDHLLKANYWYHIRLQTRQGRTQMWVDNELIVSYLDPEPIAEGWFGFRTTWSHTQITNYRYETLGETSVKTGIPLQWVGEIPATPQPVTFGLPLAQGELREVSNTEKTDAWVNARWPDGSVKWVGIASVVPPDDNLTIKLQDKKFREQHAMDVRETDSLLCVNTGRLQAWIAKHGSNVMDSLAVDGIKVGGSARLVAADSQGDFTSHIGKAVLERAGNVSAVVRIEGYHQAADGRQGLPFVLRLYFWKGTEQVKLVHSFVYDRDVQAEGLRSLGIRFQVPLRDELFNRHIAFATDDEGVWAEAVKPLDSRRPLNGQFYDSQVISQLAAWDSYRLSQLTDNSFSIRKRATTASPWIGTFTGRRAPGYVFVGDGKGGLAVAMKDFWQSYPSTIQIEHARSSEAELTMYMWSPESEPMNLCHYDTIAHGLQASYEDVQPGMSTPYGIGRTTTLWLLPQQSCPSRDDVSQQAHQLTNDTRLLPTPEYLHQKQAFGVWSLPGKDSDPVERRLSQYLDFYIDAVEQHKWYGFWNYGDIMHAYNEERHSWRYDVGGYAWDNTELATPMWLWYSFLRTGRDDVFRMAEAMTRHNSEVDTYHMGPFAPLGSRHNVSHWGCGAKEARISQSAFLRFYYYLTCDDRTGDLMHDQTDADTLLYTLDPMRLAEPRSKFPCTAPARLRFGPDWLAYAGNWMTEYERTGNTKYLDKICTGLQSVSKMADGLFTGNKALGYYPDTGRITYEGDTLVKHTNHLATIMGGFEVMNEMLAVVPEATRRLFLPVWLDYARRYKQAALNISHNRFPVRRLQAYAAWQTRSPRLAAEAWDDLWNRIEHAEAPKFSISHIDGPSVAAPIDEWHGLSTNDAALWSLDAIYMNEVLIHNK